MRGAPQRSRRSRPTRLNLEELETRTVPCALDPFVAVEPDDTALSALYLGDLALQCVAATGTIGDSGPGDVDWFVFELSQAARVNLRAAGEPAGLDSLLGLYTGDAAEPFGLQRLALADDSTRSTDAVLSLNLAPGVYWVAVSGYGNEFFHPGISNSGSDGSTGDYTLHIHAQLFPADYLKVIQTTPGVSAVLGGSPLVLTATFNLPVDEAALDPAAVELIHSTDSAFGPTDTPINLAGLWYDPRSGRLHIQPEAPLPPGHYRLTLFGDLALHPAAFLDVYGNPLGASLSDPEGSDFVTTFRITSIEGTHAHQPNDTLQTADVLGGLGSGQLLQVHGIIGDDPTDPVPFHGNDVDLYRFTVTGDGRFALTAEVFAGRIGSFLDASLSLFDAQGNWLRTNDNTQNPTSDELGVQPLFFDPLLFAGLTEGTYYLAVTGGGNVPGTLGGFDPLVSHSGWASFTMPGEYVLRLTLAADNTAPSLLTATPGPGQTLAAPPETVILRFDEAMDLESLDAGLRITDAQGATAAELQRVSWDEASHQATYLVLNALPNGDYELRLTGVSDLAGNLISAGEHVSAFSVAGPARGTGPDPLLWLDLEPNDTSLLPQPVGTLFPNELSAGVVFAGQLSSVPPGPADQADHYRIRLSAGNNFLIQVTSPVDGVQVEIVELPGFVVETRNGMGIAPIDLAAGEYVLRVVYDGWAGGAPETVPYEILVRSPVRPESPQPLRVSPNPAIQINLPKRTPAAPLSSNVGPGSTVSLASLLVASRPAGQDLVAGGTSLNLGLSHMAGVDLPRSPRSTAALAGLIADRRYAAEPDNNGVGGAEAAALSWPRMLQQIWRTGQAWAEAVGTLFSSVERLDFVIGLPRAGEELAPADVKSSGVAGQHTENVTPISEDNLEGPNARLQSSQPTGVLAAKGEPTESGGVAQPIAIALFAGLGVGVAHRSMRRPAARLAAPTNKAAPA